MPRDDAKPNLYKGNPLDHADALLQGRGPVSLFLRAGGEAVTQLAVRLKPSDRGVLRCLVEHARRDTWYTWPTADTQAAAAGLTTDRHVPRAHKRLEALGYITRAGTQTHYGSVLVRWRVNFDKLFRDAVIARGLAEANRAARTPAKPPVEQLALPAETGDEIPSFLASEHDAGVIFDHPRGDHLSVEGGSFVASGVIFSSARGDHLSLQGGSKITQTGEGNDWQERSYLTTGFEPRIELPLPIPLSASGEGQDVALTWEAILQHVSIRISRQNYETYFAATWPLHWELDGRSLLVTAPNANVADWLSTRLNNVVRQAVAAVVGPEYSVRFMPRDSPC